MCSVYHELIVGYTRMKQHGKAVIVDGWPEFMNPMAVGSRHTQPVSAAAEAYRAAVNISRQKFIG